MIADDRITRPYLWDCILCELFQRAEAERVEHSRHVRFSWPDMPWRKLQVTGSGGVSATDPCLAKPSIEPGLRGSGPCRLALRRRPQRERPRPCARRGLRGLRLPGEPLRQPWLCLWRKRGVVKASGWREPQLFLCRASAHHVNRECHLLHA